MKHADVRRKQRDAKSDDPGTNAAGPPQLREYAKFFPTDPLARAVSTLGVEFPNLLVSIGMTAVLIDR
jgi:hypothetical protein